MVEVEDLMVELRRDMVLEVVNMVIMVNMVSVCMVIKYEEITNPMENSIDKVKVAGCL